MDEKELLCFLESRMYDGQAIIENYFTKISDYHYRTGYVDGVLNAYREIYNYLKEKIKK